MNIDLSQVGEQVEGTLQQPVPMTSTLVWVFFAWIVYSAIKGGKR